MKTRTRKRVLVFMLALVFTLSALSLPANKVSATQPRFAVIRSLTANLSVDTSDGKAICDGHVHCADTSYTMKLVVKIQRSTLADTWTTLKSWSTSGSGGVYLEHPWFVSSGYFYRVLVTATVYDANGNFVEEQTASSEMVEY